MPDLNDISNCEVGHKIISGRIPGSGEGKDLRSFVRKRIGVESELFAKIC
jgi:hypothetical protein